MNTQHSHAWNEGWNTVAKYHRSTNDLNIAARFAGSVNPFGSYFATERDDYIDGVSTYIS